MQTVSWATRWEAAQNPCEPDTKPVALEPRIVIWGDDRSKPLAIRYPTNLREDATVRDHR